MYATRSWCICSQENVGSFQRLSFSGVLYVLETAKYIYVALHIVLKLWLTRVYELKTLERNLVVK